MLGNLKEFIAVVQDGIGTNNNIRQTLKEVQKVRNIFKDKEQTTTSGDSKVNYEVGGELLAKYQEQWAQMHQTADVNAKAAEKVDKLITELHEATKSRFKSANEMANKFSELPALTASVAQCINSLKNVQSSIKSLEEEFVELEDIIERNKMAKWKLDHHYQLTLYKEKKMAALEETRCRLAKENLERNYEKEKKQLAEMQALRENSATAFQEDVAKYLATGTVQRSSNLVNEHTITLEQVQLDDDTTDLEKFLDS